MIPHRLIHHANVVPVQPAITGGIACQLPLIQIVQQDLYLLIY
jgi:hypothetical protein